MSTSIVKTRKEIKSELANVSKKTAIDAFLYWIGRGRPVSVWMGIMITFLLTTILTLIVAALSGELFALYQLGQKFSPGWVIWIVFSLFMTTVSMILANAYFHRVVTVLRDQVIDIVETHKTLDEIQSWVRLVSGKPLILVVAALLGGFISATYLIAIINNASGLILGFGSILALTLFSLQSSIFVGFGLLILLLALHMRNFELRLFEPDPASSEIITNLSSLFSGFVYLVAIYGSIQTFGVVRAGLAGYYVPLLLLFWTPIVAIFIASQLSLAQIIQRAKWKTLNSIQQKIIATQKEQALPQKEDRESLIWLLDYHERVKATRNSALDLSSGISFLNSLLLPLIAFILGNIDTILQLFSGRP